MIKQLTAFLLCLSATWTLTAADPSTDGVSLITSPPAALECADGETGVFEPGAKLFSTRPYTATEVPETLRGFKFIRGNIDHVRAVCRQPGVVYVVTPSPNRTADSRAAALLERGFQMVNLPEFLLFGGDSNRCSVYQKQLAAGDILDLGKWGLLVTPQKDAAPSPAANGATPLNTPIPL